MADIEVIHQDIDDLPSPVVCAADVVASCREAETALRAATEMVTWAVQRAVERAQPDNPGDVDAARRMQLAAVLDARNAELKRACINLALTAADVRAELS